MSPLTLAFIFLVVLFACVLIIIILPEVPTPPSPRNNVTDDYHMNPFYVGTFKTKVEI